MDCDVSYCVPQSYIDMHTNSIPVQVWSRKAGEIVPANAPGCQWDEVGINSALLWILTYHLSF